MLFRVLSTLLFSIVLAGSATAAEGAHWHHLHLGAPDPAEAAAWYARNLGGEAVKYGPWDIAVFGETLVVIAKRTGPQEGSVGSSVDHVGWSFADLDAKMKEFEAAGVKILAPAMSLGKIKFGFIEDPWGTKIEVMQDPDLLGFHHVHLHVTDPAADQAWYAKAFGGEVTRYAGVLPAVKFPGMWLIFQKTPQAKAPTMGRSVDHLGWRFDNLEEGIAHLKSVGIEPKAAPAQFGALKFAFIEGSGGVRIEVLENEVSAAAAAAARAGDAATTATAAPGAAPAAEDIH